MASTAPPRHAHRVRAVLLALVLVVAAGEIGVRVAADRLPDPLYFHSADADLKVEQMDRLASTGGADVVFVGTSQVAWGVRPEVVEAQLDGAVAYNAALGGATPLVMEPWTLEVVLPRLTPDVVVVGVSSLDFQDSALSEDIHELFADSVGGRPAVGAENPLDRVDRWLTEHSSLWSHRFDLRDPAVWKGMLRGGPDTPAFIESIDEGGRNRIGEDFTFRPRTLTGPGVEEWEMGVANASALERLLAGIEAAGSAAVLVNMPVTEEFVEQHPRGADDYEVYEAALRDLATATGASLLDYEHHDLRSFGDLIHFNGVGATAFSEQLADDLATTERAVAAVVESAGKGEPAGPSAPDDPRDQASPGTGTADVPADPGEPGSPVPPEASGPPPTVAPAVTIPPVTTPEVTVPPVTAPEPDDLPTTVGGAGG